MTIEEQIKELAKKYSNNLIAHENSGD